MIVAVINAKGGVGKTTSSIYLGVAFHQQHHPVTLIDIDPQGSASQWSDYATEYNSPLPFPVIDTNANRFPRVIGEAEHNDPNHVVIIDTPPGDAGLMDLAARAADFVVIPTRASGMDLAQVWKTLQPLKNTPHGVLLTATRKHTRNLQDVKDVLNEENVAIFEADIPSREAIKRAFGGCPDDLMGYEKVAHEIMEAFQ